MFKYMWSELCSMPDLSMLSNYSYRQRLFGGKCCSSTQVVHKVCAFTHHRENWIM